MRVTRETRSYTQLYPQTEQYLTGNPCAAFKFYRLYVIGILPQLECLDGVPVLYTERLAAKADFDYIESEILEQESIKTYNPPIERASEIRRQLRGERDGQTTAISTSSKPEKNRLISKNGRVLNSNQAGARFTLVEEDDAIILTVKLPKYMDTSLIDVDVQPTFVRVVIKGKLLQLVLSAEVQSDRSVAQRSLASGDLVVTMPTADGVVKPRDLTSEAAKVPPLEPIP
ncbi:Leucine-rich repeat-containing protein 6 [Daphnia magna]|uniref:Leucine-rich repeat-containing protein 6 n=1 Tax=Daphnia magna TaxID=35525 RepID=A0A162R2Z1_9CRUS|nr:Leucine-rich repeat-containing protein 6 [Daphnia magna]